LIYRDKLYLKWIRQKRCCACGAHQPCEAHHEDTLKDGGMALKTHDYLCLPLCAECHRERHSEGLSFWDNWRVEPWRLQIRYLMEYVNERS